MQTYRKHVILKEPGKFQIKIWTDVGNYQLKIKSGGEEPKPDSNSLYRNYILIYYS